MGGSALLLEFRTKGHFLTGVSKCYGAGAGYALGAIVSSSAKNYKNGVDGDAPDTSTTSSFAWYDGAVQSSVTHNPNTSNATLYTTTYAYSGSGTLLSATIADGRPRTVTYTSDLSGQTIRRDEADNNSSAGDPHEVWFRFNGKQMGYSGNNPVLSACLAGSRRGHARHRLPDLDRQPHPATGTGAFRRLPAPRVTGQAGQVPERDARDSGLVSGRGLRNSGCKEARTCDLQKQPGSSASW